MKNMTELRTALAQQYNDLREGVIDHKLAQELNNTAGKIINSCKVEIEFMALTKQDPKIDFFNVEQKKIK